MPTGVYIRSEAVRKQMSECRKRDKISPPSFKGHKHTENAKLKIANAHKGNKYLVGYKQSEEHKKKISDSHKKSGFKPPFRIQPEKENSHNWNGGTNIYRKIVSEAINRKLKHKEIVHHIDKNHHNNELSNLFVFRHNYAHLRWHIFLNRHGLADSILESNIEHLAST